MLQTRTDHVVKAPLPRVWQAWTDPKEVSSWLNLLSVEVPQQPGDRLRWTFNRRSRLELSFTAQLLEVAPQETVVYAWDVPGNDDPTRVVVTFEAVDAESTKVAVEHSGFGDSERSRVEFDAYDHHWWHYLERLGAYLEHRPFQFHKTLTPAKTGIIPLGVTPDTGIVVQDVVISSAADAAGLTAGDRIRAIDGMPMTEMEDFHIWLDDAVPGRTAVLTLEDRTVELVPRPFNS